MHMLFLLSTVVASHPLGLEASVPAHLEGRASLLLPSSQEVKFHLLAAAPYGQSDDPGRITRYYLEYASGLLIGTVGVVVGMGAVSDYPTLTEAALPTALGIVGSSVGVASVGWALGGRGRLDYALLGSFIGVAAPLLVGTPFLLLSDCDKQALWNCGAMEVMLPFMLFLPPLAAAVAYEHSAPTPWLEEGYASRSPRPAPRFVPMLTLTRQGVGATLGIAGRL